MTRDARISRKRIDEFLLMTYGEKEAKWYVYRNRRTQEILITQAKACKCLEFLGVYDSHEQARQRAQEANGQPRKPLNLPDE